MADVTIIVNYPHGRSPRSRYVSLFFDQHRQTLTVQPENGPGIDYPLDAIHRGGSDLGPAIDLMLDAANRRPNEWIKALLLSANVCIDGKPMQSAIIEPARTL